MSAVTSLNGRARIRRTPCSHDGDGERFDDPIVFHESPGQSLPGGARTSHPFRAALFRRDRADVCCTNSNERRRDAPFETRSRP